MIEAEPGRGRRVLVVGAGLSGLCCARAVQRLGGEAHLYEASDGVGGRVRTDRVNGYLLDRGFQVMFTAYPAICAEIDLDALKLHNFEPGAIIYRDGLRHVLADPIRSPGRALEAATSSLIPMPDKLKVLQLTNHLRGMSVEQIFALPDQTMEKYLREFGFGDEFLERFITPFYGGIFLERALETTARMFAFVFKMLAEGHTSLPEQGMGAIGAQIAADLAPNSLHLNSPVRELTRQGERVTGIRLEDGTKIDGDIVVVAVEADKAAKLTGLPIDVTWRVSTDVTFALPESLYPDRLIALHADEGMLVNNFAQITNVARSYAPAGMELLSATILGSPGLTDAETAEQAKREIAAHFPRSHRDTWELLRVYRVPWAQFAQPVGVFDGLPKQRTGTPGLILAGEYTSSSSLHGALEAGRKAAELAVASGE